jgi:hypothetical protein
MNKDEIVTALLNESVLGGDWGVVILLTVIMEACKAFSGGDAP